jgi:two-component system KDP operon response regulator KdpE
MADGNAKTRALLVEDDPNIVDLVRSNLSVRGFDTVISTDGVRALRLLETEDPDIVLLDLMLPGADGMQLCRQIRERSSVGIIVVSARGGEHDKVTAVVKVGNVEVDLAGQRVSRDGEPVHLTPTEFALLRELVLHAGKLLTHAQLLRLVWGPGYETETEYIRVYVRRLRAKLETPDGPPLILTQPRAGYRLACV